MADVYVSMGQAAPTVRHISVMFGAIRTGKITSSGTASSTNSPTAVKGDVAVIWCASAVIARADGTASQSAGLYIPAGLPREIYCEAGQVISVIDAT